MIAMLALSALLCAPARAKDAVKQWASELDGADLPRQIVAARVLGRLGKPEGVAPLLSRLDPKRCSPRLTTAIVTSLGQLRDARAVDPLLGVWDYLGSVKLELGDLPAALQTMRAAVVEAVGEIGDPKGTPLLEQALGDADPAVAQKAALGLGRVGDTASVEAVTAFLPRGGDWAQAACEALGLLDDPRAAKALEGALKSDDPAVRVEAAYGLAERGGRDKKRRQPLLGLMRDETLRTPYRILAAYYLSRLDDRYGLEFLERLAEKGKPDDQARAVEALGKSRDPRAAAPLWQAARSPDPSVRLLAAQGLGRLGGPKAASSLRKLRDEDRSQRVKEAARIALDDLGEE